MTTSTASTALPMARASRLGVVGAIVFLALSVLWDWFMAPDRVERLLLFRALGIALLVVIGVLSYPLGRQARWLIAAVAGVTSAAVCAAVVLLPFGFAYGTGGMMVVCMGIGLVSSDKRTAATAVLAALFGAVVTLSIGEAGRGVFLAMGFFVLPGFVGALALAHVTSVRLLARSTLRSDLSRLRDDLSRFGRIDELTGVHDHRMLMQLSRREIAVARRRKAALSALRIDVAGMGKLNEQYGTAAGDEALRAIASMCQATLRETDFLARVGGDSFAAVLPDADPAGAGAIRDRLLQNLAGATLYAAGRVVEVNVHVGAATLQESDQSIDDLLARAGATEPPAASPTTTTATKTDGVGNGSAPE